MTEKKARIYTILIKVGIAIIATAFLILFIFQYSKMIKLQNQNDALKSELTYSTQQNNDLQNQIDSIQDPDNEDQPTEEYVVDTAHGNGYVGDDETLITGGGNGN